MREVLIASITLLLVFGGSAASLSGTNVTDRDSANWSYSIYLQADQNLSAVNLTVPTGFDYIASSESNNFSSANFRADNGNLSWWGNQIATENSFYELGFNLSSGALGDYLFNFTIENTTGGIEQKEFQVASRDVTATLNLNVSEVDSNSSVRAWGDFDLLNGGNVTQYEGALYEEGDIISLIEKDYKSPTTQGDINENRSFDGKLKDIRFYVYSSDDDTLDATLEGWTGESWDTLASQSSGGSGVLLDKTYDDPTYEKLRIFLDDTEDNDDIYYEYNVTATGLSLNSSGGYSFDFQPNKPGYRDIVANLSTVNDVRGEASFELKVNPITELSINIQDPENITDIDEGPVNVYSYFNRSWNDTTVEPAETNLTVVVRNASNSTVLVDNASMTFSSSTSRWNYDWTPPYVGNFTYRVYARTTETADSLALNNRSHAGEFQVRNITFQIEPEKYEINSTDSLTFVGEIDYTGGGSLEGEKVSAYENDTNIFLIGFEKQLSSEWNFSGDADWKRTSSYFYSGNYSLRSGDIADYDTSTVSREVQGPANISFYWRTGSEVDDYLRFYVDGSQQYSISGDTSWMGENYELSSGSHVLEWSYEKDGFSSYYEDAGFLDNLLLGNSPKVNSTEGFKFTWNSSTPGYRSIKTNMSIYGVKGTSSTHVIQVNPVTELTINTSDPEDIADIDDGSIELYGNYTRAWDDAAVSPDNTTLEVTVRNATDSTVVVSNASMSFSQSSARWSYSFNPSSTGNYSYTVYAETTRQIDSLPFPNQTLTDRFQIRNITMELKPNTTIVGSGEAVKFHGTASYNDDKSLTGNLIYIYENGQRYKLGNFTGFEEPLSSGWSFSGDADWNRTDSFQYEGNYSLRSGDIGDYETSTVSRQYHGPAKLDFQWRASSETDDYLFFYIDGSQQNSISGDTSWMGENYELSSGSHVLEWSYEKDGFSSYYEDAGFLDNVWVRSPTKVNSTGGFNFTWVSNYPGDRVIKVNTTEDGIVGQKKRVIQVNPLTTLSVNVTDRGDTPELDAPKILFEADYQTAWNSSDVYGDDTNLSIEISNSTGSVVDEGFMSYNSSSSQYEYGFTPEGNETYSYLINANTTRSIDGLHYENQTHTGSLLLQNNTDLEFTDFMDRFVDTDHEKHEVLVNYTKSWNSEPLEPPGSYVNLTLKYPNGTSIVENTTMNYNPDGKNIWRYNFTSPDLGNYTAYIYGHTNSTEDNLTYEDSSTAGDVAVKNISLILERNTSHIKATGFIEFNGSVVLEPEGQPLANEVLNVYFNGEKQTDTIEENFDGGIDPDWDVAGGISSDSCGSVSGDALYFDNSTRYAVSPATTATGQVEFYLKIGDGSSPCEDAESGEGVDLQYSADGGSSWTTMQSFAHDCCSSFTHYSFDKPDVSGDIEFRWIQSSNNGDGYDNWAMDEVKITGFSSTDASGNYSVVKSPTPGKYNVTINFSNAQGIVGEATSKFTVWANTTVQLNETDIGNTTELDAPLLNILADYERTWDGEDVNKTQANVSVTIWNDTGGMEKENVSMFYNATRSAYQYNFKPSHLGNYTYRVYANSSKVITSVAIQNNTNTSEFQLPAVDELHVDTTDPEDIIDIDEEQTTIWGNFYKLWNSEPVDSSQSSATLVLKNQTGDVIIDNQSMSYDSGLERWEYTVDLQSLQNYTYRIYASTTEQVYNLELEDRNNGSLYQVKNISIDVNPVDPFVNQGDNLTFSGFAFYQSSGSPVSNKPLNITIDGEKQTADFIDDFNDGIDSGWATSGASASDSCGSVSGDAMYFDGSTRYAVSPPSYSNGKVEFYLKIGTGSSPCEAADSGEGVDLQYSADGGSSWTTMQSFAYDCCSSFTHYSFDKPDVSGDIEFRWIQSSNSGSGYDNWAVDNVEITAQPATNSTGGFSIDYQANDIPGNRTVRLDLSDPANISGINRTEFAIRLELDNSRVYRDNFSSESGIHMDELYVVSSNVSNSTNGPIAQVWADITRPGEPNITVKLSNTTSPTLRQIWNNSRGTEETFGDITGNYTAYFYANDSTRLGSEKPAPRHNFSLECAPPQIGDWTLNDSCTMMTDEPLDQDLLLEANHSLNLAENVTLKADLATQSLHFGNPSNITFQKGAKLYLSD